jgi:uncharacterized cupin superfamily protein
MDELHVIFDSLEPDPLDPGQVIAGAPATSDLVLSQSTDGTQICGFWKCTPGTFSDIELEESFLVLRGRAEVKLPDGSLIEVGPGDTHSFGAGDRTVWTVHETLLKCYWARPGGS